jgi:hypothetical protein
MFVYKVLDNKTSISYNRYCHKEINMTNKNMKLLKRKRNKKMSLLTKLAYEFLPTTDKQLLSIDKDIAKL